MNYPRHHWQIGGRELADSSSIQRMSPTTDKSAGVENPGGGWDEPQLPEGAGTTQPPSQAFDEASEAQKRAG